MCWSREVGPDLRKVMEEVGSACGGDADSGDANTQLQIHLDTRSAIRPFMISQTATHS